MAKGQKVRRSQRPRMAAVSGGWRCSRVFPLDIGDSLGRIKRRAPCEPSLGRRGARVTNC